MKNLSDYKKKTKNHPGESEKFKNLLKIIQMIGGKNPVTIKDFVEACGNVTEKTIYRYINAINEAYPVEYDRINRCYRFIHGDPTKKISLNPEELFALIATVKAASNLGPHIQNICKSIILKAVGTSVTEDQAVNQCITVRMPGPTAPDVPEDIFNTISECLYKRTVEIDYKGNDDKTPKKRVVEPYGLVVHKGFWYLIGNCIAAKGMRMFKLDQISSATPRWPFRPEEGFDLDDYMNDAWGIFKGEKKRIVVRFPKDLSPYIERFTKLHPSETERTILPDGSIQVIFNVSLSDEVKSWVYSWLPNIEVVEPKELRKLVQKELREALKIYSQ